MNIVCIGSSITAGFAALMDKWPTILQMRLESWQPGTFKVFNMGVSGDTSSDGFGRFQPNVMDREPDVLVIEYGINDCVVRAWAKRARVGLEEFRKNIREFCTAAKKRDALPVLIINHPIVIADDWGPERQTGLRTLAENVKPYNAVIRDLSRELDARLIDLTAAMVARSIDPAVMVTDGAHLSTEGCRIYGEIVFDELKPILRQRGTSPRNNT